MQIQIIPEVGDQFEVKSKMYGFGYRTPAGGTGLSNWEFNEKYEAEKAIVKITKVWYDDECGYRCWAEAVNEELKQYIDRNAHATDKRIFVSQFDLVPVK